MAVEAGAGHGGARWESFNQALLAAPLNKVWDLVSDFAVRSKWLQPLDVSPHSAGDLQIPGAIRYVVAGDGAYSYERLEKLDNENHVISYTAQENTFCLAVDYVAVLSVEEGVVAGTTVFTWKSTMSPTPETTEEDFKKLVAGVYSRGLTTLNELLLAPAGGQALPSTASNSTVLPA